MKSGLVSEKKRTILRPIGIMTLAIAASLLLSRCGSEKDNNTDTLEPTFSSIYTNVLVSNCASCHAVGETAYEDDNIPIDLTSKTTAYNSITGNTADGPAILGTPCVGEPYITANNANASYFAAIIDSGINGTYNNNGCTNPDSSHINGLISLSAEEKSTILTWINSGAANN